MANRVVVRALRTRAVAATLSIACVAVSSCSSPSPSAKATNPIADRSAATVSPSQPERDRAGPDDERAGAATTPWVEQPGDLEVAVVGDSLTVSATEEIRVALAEVGIGLVSVDAVEGRRMVVDLDGRPSGIAAIDQIEASTVGVSPDIWVIALGTNDVGAEAQPTELSRSIGAVLDELGGSSAVVWIDVFIDAKADASADFGAQIREAAIARGHMVVGDWFHPAQRDGALVGDGVHLSSSGRQAFAATIAETVSRLVPAHIERSSSAQANAGRN